jgi:hypothetical protein
MLRAVLHVEGSAACSTSAPCAEERQPRRLCAHTCWVRLLRWRAAHWAWPVCSPAPGAALAPGARLPLQAACTNQLICAIGDGFLKSAPALAARAELCSVPVSSCQWPCCLVSSAVDQKYWQWLGSGMYESAQDRVSRRARVARLSSQNSHPPQRARPYSQQCLQGGWLLQV